MNSDGLVNKGIEVKAEAEAFDASSGAALLTNLLQTEDGVGDALRGQGQLKLTLNSDIVVNKGTQAVRAGCCPGLQHIVVAN